MKSVIIALTLVFSSVALADQGQQTKPCGNYDQEEFRCVGGHLIRKGGNGGRGEKGGNRGGCNKGGHERGGGGRK